MSAAFATRLSPCRPKIVRDFAAAGGMADVNGVLEIEMRCQRRKVVGIMIHVVAVARLGGPSVAAPVMGDDAIAVIEEEQHLRVPVIGRQRPAVAEDDGLTLAPVLVEDLNAVGGGDHAHLANSFAGVSGRAAGDIQLRGRQMCSANSQARLSPRLRRS